MKYSQQEHLFFHRNERTVHGVVGSDIKLATISGSRQLITGLWIQNRTTQHEQAECFTESQTGENALFSRVVGKTVRSVGLYQPSTIFDVTYDFVCKWTDDAQQIRSEQWSHQRTGK